MKNKINKIIEKIYKREMVKFNKKSKVCVKESYNEKKEDWNEKHFKYCEANIIGGKLDILEEIKNKLTEKIK